MRHKQQIGYIWKPSLNEEFGRCRRPFSGQVQVRRTILPRLVRRSRLYEVTAKNMLRIIHRTRRRGRACLVPSSEAPTAGRVANTEASSKKPLAQKVL